MHLAERRPARITASRVLLGVLLAALLVAGAVLRFTDINWDQFQHVHPDERFIVWVADTMKWPSDVPGGFFAQLGAALDPARSPLNPLRWPPGDAENAGEPRNFAYGHFPLYLLVGTAHLARRGRRVVRPAPRSPSPPGCSRSTPSAATWPSTTT